MEKIGCIVMYSKPLEKHKTVPKGTVFYTDGTEKEISLKEAANLALEMALDYGYINAIDNERYFNTTYTEFINNKEKYKEIATGKKKEETPEVKKTTVDKDTTFRNLPPDIVEVEPPKVVKDETTKKEEKVEKPEEVIKTIINEQEVYGPAPEEYIEEEVEEAVNAKPEEGESEIPPIVEEVEEEVKEEEIPEEVQPVEKPEEIVEEIKKEQQIVYGPAPYTPPEEGQPVEEPDEIDYDEIERKLNEILDKALKGTLQEESKESELMDMIDEQNKDIEDTGTKKR